MLLRRSSVLPCPVETVAGELARPALLDEIAAPMLTFVPVDPPAQAASWDHGKHLFRLLVGGRVPIGVHTINVQRVVSDPAKVATDPLVWHDAGYSDLISVWDHKITLEDWGGSTRYTDVVEVRAGLLTVPAWLFARAFYGHRQRKLRRLAARGAWSG